MEIEKRIARLQKLPEVDLVVEDLEESINLIQLDAPGEETEKIKNIELPDSSEKHIEEISQNDEEKILKVKETEVKEQLKDDETVFGEIVTLLDMDLTNGNLVIASINEQFKVEPSQENILEKFPTIDAPEQPSLNVDNKDDDFMLHRRLIRSNSYTLENPSPLLLEHLAGKGISLSASAPEVPSKMSTSLPVSRISKVKPTTSVSKKLFPSNKINVQKRNYPVSTLKSKRSPYDIKHKPKTLKKRKNVTNLDQKVLATKAAVPKTPLSPIQQLDQKIVDFQDQYNQKMLQLMRQQEEEHARMQEKFKQQQEELLSRVYLINPMDGNRTSTPMDINGNNQFSSSSFNLSSSQTLNLSNTITDADDSITSQNFYTCINPDVENTISHKSSSPLNRSLQINEYMEQIKQKYQLEQNYDLNIQVRFCYIFLNCILLTHYVVECCCNQNKRISSWLSDSTPLQN